MSEHFDIRPLDPLDPAQEAVTEHWLGVHNGIQRELFGDTGSAWTVAEMRAFHRRGDRRRVDLAAFRDGEVVGALEVMMPLHDNHHMAMLWLSVHAAARGHGIGSALLDQAERIAADNGRTTILAETEWAAGDSDTREGWAKARGYAIAQTTLRSRQVLPADRDQLTTIVEGPGTDAYLVETIVDELPQAWFDDLALLRRRMSTDAPLGDLQTEEEVWDVDRVRAQHESIRAGGRRVLVSVARHVPTGHLVGYTDLHVPTGDGTLAYQQDTLVVREHRGHGLGARLKAATALRLMDELPDVRSIRTWNADDNTHMLAVNRQLGYVVDGYSREWQKVVS